MKFETNQKIEEAVEKYKELITQKNNCGITVYLLSHQLNNQKYINQPIDIEKVQEINSEIEKAEAKIKKIDEILNKKSRYFNVPLQSLITEMLNELKSIYPDEEITLITNTIKNEVCYCDIDPYGPDDIAYLKEFEIGFQVGSDRQMTFGHKNNFARGEYNASDMFIQNKEINLLNSGLISNNINFCNYNWQDIFWGMFKNNISKAVDNILNQKLKMELKYNKDIENILE